MEFNSWLLFATISCLASITPGPSVVASVAHTLEAGIRGAIFTIIGHLIAIFFMAAVAAIGVGAILHTSPEIFKALKIAGGMYLGWMGIKMVRSSFSPIKEIGLTCKAVVEATNFEYVIRSALVSISNPKAIVFLSAVFPTFINRSSSIPLQFFILFVTIICIVTTVHGFYAYMAFRAKRLIAGGTHTRRVLSRISGLSFLGFGVSFIYEAQK